MVAQSEGSIVSAMGYFISWVLPLLLVLAKLERCTFLIKV